MRNRRKKRRRRREDKNQKLSLKLLKSVPGGREGEPG